MVSWGFGCMIAAALVLFAGARLGARWVRHSTPVRVNPAIAALFVLACAVPRAHAANVPAGVLQARIDAAPPGSTLVVPAAVYRGAIVVRGPLTVVGEPGATIDGGGHGSVVTISGSNRT